MNPEQNTTIERQPYAIRQGIKKMQAEGSIADYLRAQGVEVKRNRTRCIIHGGDNPQSFSINPETKKWRCHACGLWGDVVDLCKLVEGHIETQDALVSLSLRFGIELPARPERWHKRQDEKAKVREAKRQGLTKVYQRRFYRMLRDPGAHPEDDAALWDEMYLPAYLAASQRVFG